MQTKQWIFIATIICFLQANTYSNAFDKTLKLLKKDLKAKNAHIYEVYKGRLAYKKMHYFRLKKDYKYQLFTIVATPLENIKAKFILNYRSRRNRMKLKTKVRYLEKLNYYHWEFTNFKNIPSCLILEGTQTSMNVQYCYILASEGRGSISFSNREEAYDEQGNKYEISNGKVYKNTNLYYRSRKYMVESIAVTPNGKLYMITQEGYVLKRTGILYKRKKSRALKMVTTKLNNVYILCSNGVVLKNGRVYYKRSRKHRVVNLEEEKYNAWIILASGKRIEIK